MSNLRTARRVVYVILAILLAVDLAALGFLALPLLTAGSTRDAEFQLVRRQIEAKKRVVIPPDQVQSRVDEAGKQIAAFYKDRIPSEASAITDRLGQVAGKSGIHLLSARYEAQDSGMPGLRQVNIDATLSGDYLQEVKFINSLERDPMFFIVNRVSLGEQGSGQVRLQVNVETFMQGGAAE